MTDRQLSDLALDARNHAYTPYSNFKVGAALLCADGTVFTGCNVENAAYGSTICAERVALVKAVSEGYRDFAAIAIAGSGEDFCWPCGSCRQMLCEFAPGLRVLAVRQDGQFEAATLDALLPHAFGPAALN
ncbi:MAG: cytidine deaminase [Ruminococcaceae bacterium]|nr:cytidine deaminase [Oscillospiraceae bacterium]